MDPTANYYAWRRTEIRRLREQGLSYQKISEHFGYQKNGRPVIAPGTVHRTLQRMRRREEVAA